MCDSEPHDQFYLLIDNQRFLILRIKIQLLSDTELIRIGDWMQSLR